MLHVPWWQFARYHEALPISADIVVCDGAMGEMDTLSLVYNLLIARAMVDASDCTAFMFRRIGEPRVNQLAAVEQRLDLCGFTGRRIGEVSIYSLPGRLDHIFPADVDDLPCLGQGGGARRAVKSFLTFQEAEVLESYAFFKYIGIGK
jgi:hypothetical protein